MNNVAYKRLLEQESILAREGYTKFTEKMLSLNADWHSFMETGRLDNGDHISSEILESWQRSRECGVDPYEPKLVYVTQEELEESLRENKTLIEISEICVKVFMSSLNGTQFRVDLLDPNLTLINQMGEKANILQANKEGTFPGTTRKECYFGTTSGCLAARHKKPFQLVGPQHYKQYVHHWTCSSSPIHGPDGELLGVLSMSGSFIQAHEHTMGMVIAITKAIEYCYTQELARAKLEQANQYIDEIINTISDGIIATDLTGKITIMNKTAGKLLNSSPEKMLGQQARDCLGEESSLVKALDGNSRYRDHELVFATPQKRVLAMGSVFPVGSDDEKIGTLTVFKGMRSTRGLVKNVAGLRAFFTFDDIIGDSRELKDAKALAKRAAKMPFNILLQGGSGTGKELFAQSIHNESSNSDGPFVSINCGAIPSELIESELFGYETGAFTGAKQGGKPGKFQLAEGGTLFLDEINSMPLNMQVKLLRVLQNRCFTRIGGVDEIPLNAKVITASNTSLIDEVREGNFREDLYFRINVIDISLPSLRDCQQDIPLLAKHFLKKTCSALEVDIPLHISAIKTMMKYSWPGNIRELENTIEKLVVLALAGDSKTIGEAELRQCRCFGSQFAYETGKAGSGRAFSLADNERLIVENALSECGGNKTKTAQMLGITRKTLYKKIRDFEIEYVR